MKLKLSSRQSVLAKTQAFQVGEALCGSFPEIEVEYMFRESLGDKNLTDPLWKMPEKGVFTEDFYRDLIEERTDLVVHSWKDLPTEGKPDTRIVATLERADQRDLLLLKKTSMRKPNLRFFSSSPRRAFNLKEFFSWALPWKCEGLEFVSVRGNIPTRVKKLLEDPQTDGLILAKAAFDRLLVDSRFPETIEFLRGALDLCQWMVLPLSENPNAAAQGALAIEAASHRTDVIRILEKLNCRRTFQTASRERSILREFGGGCHLALGMAVLDRPYGRIEIVKGRTPQGENVHSKKFISSKPLPKNLKISRLQFSSHRNPKLAVTENVEAVFVSKADAWPEVPNPSWVVWTAGLKTWRKLAEAGVWIHGSSEGLGEAEDPRIHILTGREMKWARLSHDQAPEGSDKAQIGTYQLNLSLLSSDIGGDPAFSWRSASEFRLALQKFPELRNRLHVCGPGRTFDGIREVLGSEDKLYVELKDEFITVV